MRRHLRFLNERGTRRLKLPRRGRMEKPMPCNLQIVRAGDFVRLDGHGEVDLNETAKA